MDLQARILELESNMSQLIKNDNTRRKIIEDVEKDLELIHKSITLIFNRMDRMDEVSDARQDFMAGWVENYKSSNKHLHEENIARHEMIMAACAEINVVRERLSTIFYKVFPEVELADEALERVVQAERAERKNKPTE